MNCKDIRAIFVHAWCNRSVRIAFASSVALTLVMAGLTAMGQSRAAGAGAEIRATGGFTTVFSANIGQQAIGDLNILTRYAMSEYTGLADRPHLEGTTVTLQTIARDDVVLHKAFQTNTGIFWGALMTPERLEGSFSFIVHLIGDRVNCPCPPGVVPIDGNVVVIEGTGKGELEGICGGGTFKGTGVAGVPTDYDYTFRFGKDCKANN